LALEDGGQIAGLLLGGAEGVDHRADQTQTLPAQLRGAGGPALHLEDMALDGGPAGAAVRLRPGGGHPTLFVEGTVPPAAVVLVGGVHADTGAANDVLPQGLPEEGPDLGAEVVQLWVQFQIHLDSSRCDSRGNGLLGSGSCGCRCGLWLSVSQN